MTSGTTEYEVIQVTGSRHYDDQDVIDCWLDSIENPEATIIIAGGAPGADTMIELGAKRRGIHVARVDALWPYWFKKTGRRKGNPAGPIRNNAMLALRPDRVVAFHKDILNSTGTKDMVEQAAELGLPVELHDE